MKLLNRTLSYLSVAFLLVIGIWAAILYFNLLDEIYDSIDDGLDNSKILIIEKAQRDSTIIYKTSFMESNYAIREIPMARARKLKDTYIDSTLFMVNEQDYEPVRILKTAFRAQNGRYYQLDVVSSIVEEDDLITDLFYSIVWLYVILLASILVINNILLKRIWKPFYAILDRLKRFSLESPEPIPAPDTRVTEFKMLHESVTALLDRTLSTFNNQKQFIENASHELQTPLAISINKLELLIEKESLPEAELHDISSVIQSLERLTRLNKTLLLLSKIENRQFPTQVVVNLNEVTDRALGELSDLADYKSVTISNRYEATLTTEMNPELASILVFNLLKNAIVHNVDGGTVDVTINSTALIVENTSQATKLDASKIFTRFYKSTKSNASTGLGLSMVKSIADYYALTVQYDYDQTHRFIVIVNPQ